MNIPFFQVDAFADQVLRGNPAAVCLLEDWLTDSVMQQMAAEHNQAETVFVRKEGNGKFGLRWFTPGVEVDLCGHATLAAAFVLFNEGAVNSSVTFDTRSGSLTVQKVGDLFIMDFPAMVPEPCAPPDGLLDALNITHCSKVLKARDHVVVLESQQAVLGVTPDMQQLRKFDWVVVTAPGDVADCVSRFFAPGAGVPEDPVTGSAHCTLAPYWCEELGKRTLHARQISSRGGDIFCEYQGDRVKLAGQAVLYSKGTIYLSGGVE